MRIPTRRDENGYILFQVSSDIEVVFNPDDKWVEVEDKTEHASAIFWLSDIDKMIETLKRIKRMATE